VDALQFENDENRRGCIATGDTNSCAQVLACIGTNGLWFRGQALGWNEGTLIGEMSDGTACTGEWGPAAGSDGRLAPRSSASTGAPARSATLRKTERRAPASR